MVFWHKFGYPEGYLTRIGDYRDIPLLWWNDPGRGRALEDARKSPTGKLAVGPSDNRFWLDFAAREKAAAPAPR